MYYDKMYFEWQKEIGKLGGIANKFKFEKHIKKQDTVVDFGSGGGYLLENIDCGEKLGIEINETAREEAGKMGIVSVGTISDVENDYADVIISNHALEHVANPLGVLKELHSKLKDSGSIVFVVPHENSKQKFNENDINKHLYTWTRQTLGNLFKEAGFNDVSAYNIRSKWPPFYLNIYGFFGLGFFKLVCYFWALMNNNYQIKVVAKK